MDPKSLPGGWPAFPTDNEQQNGPSSYHYEGMSLRDYLAAKAMQGICAHPDKWGEVTDGIGVMAYRVADAMLEAREVQA